MSASTHTTHTTRPARPDDVPLLLPLMMAHGRELHYGEPSARRLLQAIDDVTQRGRIIVSCDEHDRPVAYAALVVEQPIWSEDWQVNDVGFFVEPRHRNTRHTGALLAGAQEFARNLGLPLCMGVLGSRIEGKMRLMRRHFGEPVGATFFIRTDKE